MLNPFTETIYKKKKISTEMWNFKCLFTMKLDRESLTNQNYKIKYMWKSHQPLQWWSCLPAFLEHTWQSQKHSRSIVRLDPTHDLAGDLKAIRKIII